MTTNFIPSIYQEKIYNFVQNGEGHGLIEAVAGSGKTTTIVNSLKLIPKNEKVIFLAFGVDIVAELETKVPSNIQVSTSHSLGLSAIRNTFGNNVEVDKNKIYNLFIETVSNMKLNLEREDFSKLLGTVKRVIGFLKNNNLSPDNQNIDELMAYHSISMPKSIKNPNTKRIDDSVFYILVKMIFIKSANDTSKVDFDDMIFLPSHLNLECEKYKYIFVDECQDINPAQLKLILCSSSKDSRIIAVGDTSQSIYGFRGSDAKSIPKLIKALNPTILPLTITYRCPKSHVEYAQKFVSHIEASKTAIEGKIYNIDDYELSEYVRENDLIICRNNAPLLPHCLKLISQGIKATIKGADIGNSLNTLIIQFKAKNMADLKLKINAWETKEIEKAELKDINPQTIIDKAECIRVLAGSSKATSIRELTTHIKSIFSDKKSPITFSSIHKAKGLEAKNVFIFHPHLMPSKWAKKDWERVQENNIHYVACTRAKENMYFVHSPEELNK